MELPGSIMQLWWWSCWLGWWSTLYCGCGGGAAGRHVAAVAAVAAVAVELLAGVLEHSVLRLWRWSWAPARVMELLGCMLEHPIYCSCGDGAASSRRGHGAPYFAALAVKHALHCGCGNGAGLFRDGGAPYVAAVTVERLKWRLFWARNVPELDAD